MVKGPLLFEPRVFVVYYVFPVKPTGLSNWFSVGVLRQSLDEVWSSSMGKVHACLGVPFFLLHFYFVFPFHLLDKLWSRVSPPHPPPGTCLHVYGAEGSTFPAPVKLR